LGLGNYSGTMTQRQHHARKSQTSSFSVKN
jgi:hypothetical protein